MRKKSTGAADPHELVRSLVTDITGIEDAKSAIARLGSRAALRNTLKIIPSAILLGSGLGVACGGLQEGYPGLLAAGAGASLLGAIWLGGTIKKGKRDYSEGVATAAKMTTEEHKRFLTDLYSGKLAATAGNIGVADSILAGRMQPVEQDSATP